MASPLVLLFATGTRLLVISNYDTTTASTIASENGAVGTLLGTLIPLLPAFLPVVGLVLLMNRNFLAAALISTKDDGLSYSVTLTGPSNTSVPMTLPQEAYVGASMSSPPTLTMFR